MENKLLSFLGITRKSGNIVFGMDSVKKESAGKKIKLILVTCDISEHSLKEIKNTAFSENIKILKIPNTKDDINNSVGKYSAIIGISNENFANKIISILNSSYLNTQLNQEECNL